VTVDSRKGIPKPQSGIILPVFSHKFRRGHTKFPVKAFGKVGHVVKPKFIGRFGNVHIIAFKVFGGIFQADAADKLTGRLPR